MFDRFALLQPSQNEHFATFSKSCHFSNTGCSFKLFLAQRNSNNVLVSFLDVLAVWSSAKRTGHFRPFCVTEAFAKMPSLWSGRFVTPPLLKGIALHIKHKLQWQACPPRLVCPLSRQKGRACLTEVMTHFIPIQTPMSERDPYLNTRRTKALLTWREVYPSSSVTVFYRLSWFHWHARQGYSRRRVTLSACEGYPSRRVNFLLRKRSR